MCLTPLALRADAEHAVAPDACAAVNALALSADVEHALPPEAGTAAIAMALLAVDPIASKIEHRGTNGGGGPSSTDLRNRFADVSPRFLSGGFIGQRGSLRWCSATRHVITKRLVLDLLREVLLAVDP